MTSQASPGVPPKSTLFCPECGHQSHIEDDWRRVETPFKTHYQCPDCDTELTVRPASHTLVQNTREILQSPVQTWKTTLRLWQSVYRTLTPTRQ